MSGISRRRFLEESLFAAAAAAAAGSTRLARAQEAPVKKAAPSDIIRVAVIKGKSAIFDGFDFERLPGFDKLIAFKMSGSDLLFRSRGSRPVNSS